MHKLIFLQEIIKYRVFPFEKVYNVLCLEIKCAICDKLKKIVDFSFGTVYRKLKKNFFLVLKELHFENFSQKFKNIHQSLIVYEILLDVNFPRCIEFKSNLILSENVPNLIFFILKSKKSFKNDILR